jgi:dCMP deaminase
MSYFRDVGEFNRKFDLPMCGDGPPTLLDEDLLLFRTKFMVEELQEFRDACSSGNLPEAADALVDLVYVALGTAHMMRVPFDECWIEVQRANMQKVRANGANDPKSKRKHQLDVVKPEGWQPPDLARIIARPSQSNDSRDNRLMELARFVAGWSKDPSTKIGAVAVGIDRREIAVGYNGFPPGIGDDMRLRDREARYALTQHAERNVLDNAKFDLTGGTLYSTMYPCVECAKSIVSKGISRVVCPPAPQPTGDKIDFRKSITWSDQILKEAGIQISIVE